MKVNPIPVNDTPLTSDSFLVAFGFPGFFPITVVWSQSAVAPFMSADGVVCVVEVGYETFTRGPCLIKY